MENVNALPAGTRLGEYEIETVLGSGGFGITYRARDTHLNTVVAIKEYLPRDFATRTNTRTVVPTSQADRDDYEWGLKRFLDEARTLALFNHPHINKVHRFFEAHGTAYLVLEYLEGRTLHEELVARGRLAEAAVVRLLREVLSGLAEVHAAGYVHRDLKPGNLMVKPDGNVVILDFGAARQDLTRRSQRAASVLHTPGYAPPEQAAGQVDRIGPWSDLYALGMIAYQCVSGLEQIPSATERLYRPGAGEGDLEPAVRVGRGEYAEELLAAIDWAIQVREDARPQSIAEWQQALPGLTPSESRASPVGPPKKPQTETTPAKSFFSRWAPAVGVVALMVAVAGGTYWYARQPGILSGGPQEAASGLAVTEPARVESQPGGPVPETGETEIEGEGEELVEADGPSAAEVEAGLGLDREARRLVQQGLLAAGQEPGPAGGFFGGETERTRQAIRAWQAAKDMEASGYLTREQADALIELGQARADDTAYAEAERTNTAESYAEYVRAYPSGRHVDVARERQAARAEVEQREAAARADDAAYVEAERVNTAESYAEYVRAYPSGRHVDVARERQAARAEAEQREAAARADDTAYAEAERVNTPVGYIRYLEAFATGRHAKDAVYKWCITPEPKNTFRTVAGSDSLEGKLRAKERAIMNRGGRGLEQDSYLNELRAQCDGARRREERAWQRLDDFSGDYERRLDLAEKYERELERCMEPYDEEYSRRFAEVKESACREIRREYPW